MAAILEAGLLMLLVLGAVGLLRAGGGRARTDGADADVVQEIPLETVSPNEQQPRRNFDQDALHELAASIAEHGLLQPVLARGMALGRFELMAGECRWRASRLAGRQSVRAIVLQDVDDVRALECALLENTARQDLTPVEEARGFAALIDELRVSKEAVARRIGKSRAYASDAVRLLDLPDDVLELIGQRRLTRATVASCCGSVASRNVGRWGAAPPRRT